MAFLSLFDVEMSGFWLFKFKLSFSEGQRIDRELRLFVVLNIQRSTFPVAEAVFIRRLSLEGMFLNELILMLLSNLRLNILVVGLEGL